ncbi:MAG TPA: MetQ/NlpA family ABC transporter substrate-binding protein [Rectinemataceae bacterium]|nr:MetQ/NlpA family ABC transporter substrate-binding protein [Rectinemataceae bacterium]
MNRKTIAAFLVGITAAAAGALAGAQTLKVGATAVPHAEILNYIKPDLAAKGIKLEVIEFTDYVTPNTALAEKQLDANFFQHRPYLESFISGRKLALESVVAVHVEPLGLYSKKYRSVSDFPAGSTIAIPNDPTNEGRALIFLQAKGLIKLKANAGLEATIKDIVDNPRKFAFKEIEAPQLPRTLDDVAGSIINGNYALQSGFNPVKDSLLLEGGDSPYANVLVVRKGDAKDPRIVALAAALTSQKVKDFILKTYGGGVVPAF